MKKLFILILFLALTLTLSAQENTVHISPITSTEVSQIRSNTVVTGTVVVENGKLPSSAIINDRIVWEGQTVTVRNDGRVIVTPRDRRERESNAPSLRLVDVANGMVTVEYARDGLAPRTFRKPIKSRR